MALAPLYLKDNILQPGGHYVRKIVWLNDGVSRAWAALRLRAPYGDLMVEVTRRA